MYRPEVFRLMAAMGLATGLFLTLPGCGSPPPSEKKADSKPDSSANTNPTLNINSGPEKSAADSSTKTESAPPSVTKVDLNSGVGKDAMDFLASLKDGVVRADRLSNGFVRAIGLPVFFPADKAKGYSADAAESCLKGTLAMHSIGLPSNSKQVGDVALFRGLLVGEPGEFCLRMINEGGAWKVDWLSLSSVQIQSGSLNASAAETVCQEFAMAAVIGTLTDKDALAPDVRATILAAGLTPALRKKWAEPFESDKADGKDYNRTALAKKATDFGAGAVSLSFSQQGNTSDYRLEITRGGGVKAAYLVKLVKGPGPGQWLVDEVIPQ